MLAPFTDIVAIDGRPFPCKLRALFAGSTASVYIRGPRRSCGVSWRGSIDTHLSPLRVAIQAAPE